MAYDVLYPTVNSFCDPDYINQSLLNWIEYREAVATAQKRTYAYAKNYEEFIRMIDQSDDVEQLKQIRCDNNLICILSLTPEIMKS